MPYKHFDPVPEAHMDMSRFEGHNSICQYLRDIYHLTDNEEIKMKCRVGMAMTKSMNDRLKKYRRIFDSLTVKKVEPDGAIECEP